MGLRTWLHKTDEGGHIDRLAQFTLALYVFVNIILSSKLTFSYPVLQGLDLPTFSQSIFLGLAICLIIGRSRSLSTGLLVYVAFAVALLSISAFRTENYRLMLGFLLLLGLSGTSIKDLFRAHLLATVLAVSVVACLSVVGALYNLGIIPNSYLVYAYGFGHPNTFAGYLISIVCSMTYVCWEDENWRLSFLLSILIGGFAFVFLSSRAGAVVCWVISVANLVGHCGSVRRVGFPTSRVFRITLVFCLLALLLTMLVCAAAYDSRNPVMTLLNRLTNERPMHAHDYYEAHGGFTVFGRKFISTSNYLTGQPFGSVDSAYCYVPLTYGLLPLCVVVIAYFLGVRELSKSSDRFPSWAILAITALYCLIESYPLYLHASCAPLFATLAFRSRTEECETNRVLHSTTVRGFIGLLWVPIAITLLSALVFHVRFASVDTGPLVGEATIAIDGDESISVQVDSSMRGSITYRGITVKGKLELATAQPDTMTYQFVNPTDASGKSSNVAMFIQVPREGLHGDGSGDWRVYYINLENDTKRSDWVLASPDGTARVGSSDAVNALLLSDKKLDEISKDATWMSNGAGDDLAVTVNMV